MTRMPKTAAENPTKMKIKIVYSHIKDIFYILNENKNGNSTKNIHVLRIYTNVI